MAYSYGLYRAIERGLREQAIGYRSYAGLGLGVAPIAQMLSSAACIPDSGWIRSEAVTEQTYAQEECSHRIARSLRLSITWHN